MDEYAACEAAYFNGFDAGKEAAREEIVHCGECVYDGRSECPLCWIENHTMNFVNHDADFYCAKGSREE